MRIVFEHRLIETAAFVGGERGGFRLQSGEQHAAIEFLPVVVGKAQRHVGEAKAVLLVHVAHGKHFRHVAVGDKGERQALALGQSGCRLFRPVVIVFHSHDEVAAREFLLAIENLRADTVVVDVGALVGARHDNHLVCTEFIVIAHQRLNQFVAGQKAHLAVRTSRKAGQGFWSFGNHLPQMRGAGQHLRGIVLPHHVREVGAAHRHSHSRENIVLQSRTVCLAHGRQLRCVAHHNEAAAVVAAVNEAQQVVEQLPRAEHGF